MVVSPLDHHTEDGLTGILVQDSISLTFNKDLRLFPFSFISFIFIISVLSYSSFLGQKRRSSWKEMDGMSLVYFIKLDIYICAVSNFLLSFYNHSKSRIFFFFYLFYSRKVYYIAKIKSNFY